MCGGRTSRTQRRLQARQRTGVASQPPRFAVEKCYYCYFPPRISEASKSPLRKSPNLQIANPLYLCRFPDDSGRQATIDYSGLNPTLFTKRPSRGGFFGIHVVRAFWGFRGRSWPLSLFPLPRPTESAATRSSSEAGHIARSIQDRLSRAFASVPREQNCRQVES